MADKSGVAFQGYKWVCTRGKDACAQCSALNGKVFTLNPEAGEQSFYEMRKPPLHPNCKCTVVEIMVFRLGGSPILVANQQTSIYPADAAFIKGGWVDPKYKLVWLNNGRSGLDGPVYEKYGGANWTAGRNPKNPEDDGPEDMTPADDMDACFARHDYGYDVKSKYETDKSLVEELETLPADPRQWARPPRDVEYATNYRKCALILFKAKIGMVEAAMQNPGGHNMHEGPYAIDQP